MREVSSRFGAAEMSFLFIYLIFWATHTRTHIHRVIDWLRGEKPGRNAGRLPTTVHQLIQVLEEKKFGDINHKVNPKEVVRTIIRHSGREERERERERKKDDRIE